MKVPDPIVTENLEHRSVLLQETLAMLAPRPGDVVLDATLGAGGHAAALLDAIGSTGRLIGIDRDPQALASATRRLERFGDGWTAVRGVHEDLATLTASLGLKRFDRILFDLGMSSLQLDDPARGFSFRVDGPLDMRMDPEIGATAAELLASWPELERARVLWRYGEERHARTIARAIVAARSQRPISRSTELADLVVETLGPSARRFKIHPATRTFQALRIAVNGEIDRLQSTIADAVQLLESGGRIVVISFHSLEDRAVKRSLRSAARSCTCPPRLPVCGCGRPDLVRLLTARPIRATASERESNPRSRSARLRAAERL